MDDLKRFWGWVVSLAVVGGLWFGAVAIDAVWEFWALIGAALVLTIFARLGPKVRQLAKRIRDYPALDAEVRVLRDEMQVVQQQLADERKRTDDERLKGIRQGRREATGVMIAQMTDVPVLKAVVVRSGQLLLMADVVDVERFRTGALYFVKSSLTDEIKGMVRVQGYDASGTAVLLECVQQRVVAFWERLAVNAEIDPAVPADVQLIPVNDFTAIDDGNASRAVPNIQEVS